MQFTLVAIAIAAIVSPCLAMPQPGSEPIPHPLIKKRASCFPSWTNTKWCDQFNENTWQPCSPDEYCSDGICEKDRCFVQCCKN
ncbi:hypothetical protein LZ554_005477 [Drepanopeziza brunnea f. sp. 'monogermtubi']|nr:hypothetical protein LZ554_005477 [Drepanopeziza brunnea f. sp. 'monogermtubi']